MEMNIAIIGAGNVGGTLGKLFAQRGHKIFFGVPSPDNSKYAQLLSACATNALMCTVPEAVAKANVIILATPWRSTKEALTNAGNLKGKIIIDCTNPLRMGTEGLELEIGHGFSGGEQVAEWAPGAYVCKCFNQVGFEGMAQASKFKTQKPVMFIAGDHAESKNVVMQLATKIGFNAKDAGALKFARLLEPFGMLWIHMAFQTPLGRNFAFSILQGS